MLLFKYIAKNNEIMNDGIAINIYSSKKLLHECNLLYMILVLNYITIISILYNV